MVSLNKPHRSHRPQFTPLEKAFAHSLYRYYHASTQAQRDEAVDQRSAAFRAEKIAAQTPNTPSLPAQRSNPGYQ